MHAYRHKGSAGIVQELGAWRVVALVNRWGITFMLNTGPGPYGPLNLQQVVGLRLGIHRKPLRASREWVTF